MLPDTKMLKILAIEHTDIPNLFFKLLQIKYTKLPIFLKKLKVCLMYGSSYSLTIKSSLYSLHYAKICNKFARPLSASLIQGNTAPFEEMILRWRAIGNTLHNLTSQRFELQTFRSRDKCVTVRPTRQ